MSTAHKMQDSQETRIALLEQTVGNINQTLIRLETKIDKGFSDINSRIWFNFYWMVAGFASVLAIMAHAFHWIL